MWHGMVEDGIIKWVWGSLGLLLCAIPVFFKIPGAGAVDFGSRTEGASLLRLSGAELTCDRWQDSSRIEDCCCHRLMRLDD